MSITQIPINQAFNYLNAMLIGQLEYLVYALLE